MTWSGDFNAIPDIWSISQGHAFTVVTGTNRLMVHAFGCYDYGLMKKKLCKFSPNYNVYNCTCNIYNCNNDDRHSLGLVGVKHTEYYYTWALVGVKHSDGFSGSLNTTTIPV